LLYNRKIVGVKNFLWMKGLIKQWYLRSQFW